MRTIFILIIVIILPISLFAQNLEWVSVANGVGEDVILDVSSDNEANIYAVGYFTDQIHVDDDILNAEGYQDAFIQKLDSEGGLLWRHRIGGKNVSTGTKIKVDTKGNCYMLGYFAGKVSIQDITITSKGEDDIFLAKFDSEGILKSLIAIGGSSSELSLDLELDTLDNIYVVGSFDREVDFGTLNNPTILNSKNGAMFVAKYNSGEQLVWVKQFGGSSTFLILDLVVKQEELFLTGLFDGNAVDFDPNDATHFLDSEGRNDGFLLNIDSAGAFKKVIQFKADFNLFLMSLVVDENLNTYTLGYFNSNINLEYATINYKHKSQGFMDVVLFKHDKDGKIQWSKQFASSTDVYGFSIALDKSNNIYSTGAFLEDVTFNFGETDHKIIRNKSDRSNAFLTVMDGNGVLLAAKEFGGVYFLDNQSVVIDKNDDVILAGSFQGSVDLDPDNEISQTFNSRDSDRDSYILKLGNTKVGTKGFISKRVSFYPNPVSEYLYFDGSENMTEAYEITDLLGKTMKTGTIMNNSIDLHTLAKGVYFLKIEAFEAIKIVKY